MMVAKKSLYITQLLCLILIILSPSETIGDMPIANHGSYPINDQDIKNQIENDINIFMATLFPSADIDLSVFNSKEIENENKPRLFFKRLLLVTAYGELMYTNNQKYLSSLKKWEYPIAMAFGHGGRILFDLTDVNAENFYNFLLTGNPNDASMHPETSPIVTKRFSSHGLTFNEKTNQIDEIQITLRPDHLVRNLKEKWDGQKRGINIALGGLGHNAPSGYLIGPGGTRYDPKTKKMLPKIQHGHFYIHVNQFTTTRGGIMIGLESSAPLHQNDFGVGHNILSGTILKTDHNKSATGGEKMGKLLGDQAPAKLGGMRVIINKALFDRLQTLCSDVLARDHTFQKNFFNAILRLNAEESTEKIKHFIPPKN